MTDEEKWKDLLGKVATLLEPLVKEWQRKGRPKAMAFILRGEYIALVEAVMELCKKESA